LFVEVRGSLGAEGEGSANLAYVSAFENIFGMWLDETTLSTPAKGGRAPKSISIARVFCGLLRAKSVAARQIYFCLLPIGQ
jgi:hypothetical protein